MTKVRWGLISTADINRRLIPAIRASKRGDLVAVASRTQEKADAYAAKWGIPHSFGSYDALLNSGLVDAVYIGLPNHLHAEWSIRAMKAGIHVLCEKPLAISVSEVDEMIAVSRRSKRVLAEAFMYRHHPQTKLVGEWVRSGRLGEIYSVYGTYIYPIPNRQDIRFVLEYGGGSLWDLGVYPMSYAQYLFGEPPVWVLGDQWVGNTGVDEAFAGQMHYTGDRIAQFTCSFRSPWYMYYEIIGTEGHLSLSRPFAGMEKGRRMIFYPKEKEPFEIQVPEVELYQGEVEDMHEAILEGAISYVSLEESRTHIRTVKALYESARTKQIIFFKDYLPVIF
jgi:D-xylose 1-dehydrogenase (NADP+, D-xylono-1,5-lactone-forming)